MGSGVASQCSRNRCSPRGQSGSPIVARRGGPGRASSKKDLVRARSRVLCPTGCPSPGGGFGLANLRVKARAAWAPVRPRPLRGAGTAVPAEQGSGRRGPTSYVQEGHPYEASQWLLVTVVIEFVCLMYSPWRPGLKPRSRVSIAFPQTKGRGFPQAFHKPLQDRGFECFPLGDGCAK